MAETILDTVRREVGRLQNRSFLEALMAVSALAAMADGDYGLAEKYRAEELLSEIPIFEVFDLSEAMEILDDDIFALRSDRMVATRDLEARVAGFAADPDRARQIGRAAHAILTSAGIVTAAGRVEFDQTGRASGRER